MHDKPTLSANIKHLLHVHDLSLSELARQTHIPQPTLHHLLTGFTKKPRAAILEKLAAFFSLSLEQLTGTLPFAQIIPEPLQQTLVIAAIPVIDWDSAHSWPLAAQYPHNGATLVIDKPVSTHTFALRMPTSSMEPLFPKDALLIFDPQKSARDRDFILLRASHSNTLLFNRLCIEGEQAYIKTVQNDNSMQFLKINPQCDKIIATLIEVRMQFGTGI